MIDNVIDFVERRKKDILLLIGLVVAMLIATSNLMAQNTEGYMYGKVYTRDNQYTGQIRWGDEEAYWHDHFNAAKIENPYGRDLDRYREKNNDSWRDIDWRISSIWEDKAQTVHQISLQFGDIQEIKNYGDDRVTVKLKNGEEYKVSGRGYNDVGTEIQVVDAELGKIGIDWNRMVKVEFLPTPKNLKDGFGKPLFGKVETYRKGTFEGFIEWDHDERFTSERLDGDTRDGDVSINFGNIKSIERRGSGSMVNTKSGRELYMTGSNDVNDGNRGILIAVDGVGKIDVSWRDFVKVDFEEAKSSGQPYSNYTTPRGLKGKVVKYRGGEVSGKIVFDLDETLEVELLEGKDDEIEYKIPFRNIKSITPKNYNFSTVVLRNGKELLLGDQRDVSADNSGLLIYTDGSSTPEYVEWKNVTEIVFE
ncbi:MAG: hypothetical protein RLO81_08475 [Fulvivirga sp.]|uniref:hypothetical protein n=1 Tax=Fulvivirga sp. TaxID=1931237 RepID=UPI0032EE6C07